LWVVVCCVLFFFCVLLWGNPYVHNIFLGAVGFVVFWCLVVSRFGCWLCLLGQVVAVVCCLSFSLCVALKCPLAQHLRGWLIGWGFCFSGFLGLRAGCAGSDKLLLLRSGTCASCCGERSLRDSYARKKLNPPYLKINGSERYVV
jgi:hypothetical protein